MTADYESAVAHHWIDLIELNGEVVALIEMIPRSDHIFVENVAVAESYQGRGLARKMLARAEVLARASELAEVRLLTNTAFASNLAMYEQLGFELTEKVPIPGGGSTAHFRKRVSQTA